MPKEVTTPVRAWVFTVNNYTDADFVELDKLRDHSTYLVYSREVGDDGTPHLQGYVWMKTKQRLSAMKKLLTRAHFEQRRAPTHQAAADYCKGLCEKKGNVLNPTVVEHGAYVDDTGAAEQDRWEKAYDAAKRGDFESVPREILIKYNSSIKKIHLEHQAKIASLDKMDFHFWHGDSGVGKSLRARAENPDHYFKSVNKWWCGYDGQACVIIDEFELDQAGFMLHFLKIWCDHYPFIGETKGASNMIRPPKIIIISNHSLEELYPNPKDRAPLLRRLQVQHMQHNQELIDHWIALEKKNKTT